MSRYQISVLPGDGIGSEVMPEALRALRTVASLYGIDLEFREYGWGCQTYLATGQMMPGDALAQLMDSDAILLGAVGDPSVPDHISLWGMLIPIRREFDQFVNLRPVRQLPGIVSPLRDGVPDYWIVRENSEGEYSQIGGRFGTGDNETVVQLATFTRRGVDRILRYAFDLAMQLGRPHVTSATKSNGIVHTMPFWDERFRAISDEYPDVATDQYHVDILAARFVMSPERFDVVVASNLFGDILSDLGPGTTGTLGLAPAANLDPTRRFPSMFEPVHGSAPDIAGLGIANPIAQIWAVSMMLDHLGEPDAGRHVLQAIEATLVDDAAPRTPDLGGRARTSEVGASIAQKILEG